MDQLMDQIVNEAFALANRSAEAVRAQFGDEHVHAAAREVVIIAPNEFQSNFAFQHTVFVQGQ